MYRILNLMRKQHSSDNKKVRPILQDQGAAQAAVGMKEVQAFIKSKSSGISSLSFSSDSGSNDEGGEEKKSDPPLRQLNGHLGASIKSSLGTESERFELSSSTTASFEASKTCEGRLVARVVPKKYKDYMTHKPLAQTDPVPFVNSLLSWQIQTGNGSDTAEAVSDGGNKQQKVEHMPSSDEESIVALDVYMLRSAYMDMLQRQKGIASDGAEDGDIDDEALQQQQRAQQISSLMSSYDVTRNNASQKRTAPRRGVLETLPTSTESSSESTTNALTTAESTVSTSSSDSSTDGKCDLSSNNLFHLHMNRASTELATRTLRRLELSTTRKLQSLNPFAYQGSINMGNYRGKEENLERIHKSTASRLVLVEGDTTVKDEVKCREVDLAEWSSAEILRVFSCNRDHRWAVALTIPKVIVPWSDTVEDFVTASSVCSASSVSLFNRTETINLDIISNPPTLLNIRTFESFTGDPFTCVPLVVETTVIYATRAVITWFVDGELVLYDSNMYKPTAADVGKNISVLVTPIRPGHNGDGCQEAYSFCNAVKPLPMMPILELREEWCRSRSVRSYTENNLRVVTVSQLLIIFAGLFA